jgi:hypothetical protein
MPLLQPDRALLNPAFEAYKLDSLEEDEVVSRHTLPHVLSQAALSGRTHVSFAEVQSRIRHNHLAVSPTGRAVYIDAELGVCAIDVDDVSSP